MRQPHRRTKSVTSRTFLISLLSFFLPFNLYSAEKNIPELHYKKAIEAYNENDCRVAIKYFDLYLSTSNIPNKKKRNINKAKRWCKKYLQTFIVISGHFLSKGRGHYDPAAERSSLLKYKPNEAGIPRFALERSKSYKKLNVDSAADAPPPGN